MRATLAFNGLNGLEEFWKESKRFGIERQIVFIFSLLISAQILLLDVTSIKLDVFNQYVTSSKCNVFAQNVLFFVGFLVVSNSLKSVSLKNGSYLLIFNLDDTNLQICYEI